MNKLNLLIIIVLCLSIAAYTQDNYEEILNKRIGSFKMTTENAVKVLKDVASENSIKLGIERSPNESKFDESLERYEMKDATFKKLLNVFVELHPNYKWEISKNVINISPKNDFDKEPTLGVNITEFVAFKENTKEITDKLLKRPEFLEYLKLIGFEPNTDSTSFGSNPTVKTDYSFQLKNRSVRFILNYMLKENKISYWHFYRNSGNRPYVKLIIRE